MSVRLRFQKVFGGILLRCILFSSLLTLALSCNTPFEPQEDFTPRLNIYSVLFAEQQTVLVKVTSVVNSAIGISQPVHGASVTLSGAGQIAALAETTMVTDNDTASLYFAPVHVLPGEKYTVAVDREGYPSATASVSIPFSYVPIPDKSTYIVLVNPVI